jgi:hypothetical protein
MSHKHVIKKTRISFIEFDDVVFNKLGDLTYFGEGNSKGRKMEFDFEYCLNCDLRMLDGKMILTKGVFDEEFEKLVTDAKDNCYLKSKEITIQHSDYDIFERLVQSVLSLSELKKEFSE